MDSVIKIKVNRAGIGTITVDGVDISRYVRSIGFSAEAGLISQCVLNLIADVEIESEVKLTLNKFFYKKEEA